MGWFRNVHKSDNAYTHPTMIFDIMPHAGASQIHPHVQGFIGKSHYLGKMGKLERVISLYRNQTKRHYLQDYINVHIALGLGLRYRTASVIVPLDSEKDNEFVISGSSNLRDWTRLLYLVHRTYIEELKVYCFSTGVAWPTSILWKNPDSYSILKERIKSFHTVGSLMLAKIAARGNCQSIENDISALELFVMNHLSTDPYRTIEALKKTIRKYG